MRSTLAAATIVCAAFISGPAPAFASDDARPAPKLQSPADEVPRPTDEALRSAMNTLRDTIDGRLQVDKGQGMAEDDYAALAPEIERQLAVIVDGRDFEGRAGRHLQWVLGDIADGVTLMRSAPRAPGKRMGLLRVVETLNFYGREYDHPGWVPLKP